MIFCLPGLLMMNAAIIKHTASTLSLARLVSCRERDSYRVIAVAVRQHSC
jgi:hypothetical protein